ncbi:MAG: hypothetical protein QOI66_1726 [Myxococcales bacterium]|nr:hypothetical protein [Myxococcales bacterium]
MTQFSSRLLMGAALVAGWGIGCTGSVGNGPGTSPPPPGGGSGGSGMVGGGSGGSGMTMMPPASGDQPVAHMHRLTSSQFANSLSDLLGAGVPIGALDPDQPTDGFVSIGSSAVVSSASGVGLYEGAADAAAAWLFADPTRATAALACLPKAATDTACASQAIAALGQRAYRRPLTTDEAGRLVTLATTLAGQPGGTMTIGMQYAVSAILQSPNFLYRVELGAPSAADGGRLKYNSYEMASRLASTLWNTVPDSMLMDAASKDSLASTDGVAAQARRMLADPRTHLGLTAFVDDLYALHYLHDAQPDPTLFPTFTATLRAAMQTELEMRIEDMVLTTRGDFLSLFDSKTTFVNDELAKHYGLPTAGNSDFRRVDLPADSPRAGILGSGAILAGLALPERTAPTRRGKFIRETLLCQTIPPPPSNVVPQLPPPTDPTETMRNRLSVHRAAPSCAACHALTDPLGFGLENFDAVGKYRSLENGHPVDATGDLNGAKFDGLAQMGTALRNAAVSGPCFVSKLYMNAQSREAGERDAAILDKLATDFAASGNKADQLLIGLVSSEPFRFVEPTQP